MGPMSAACVCAACVSAACVCGACVCAACVCAACVPAACVSAACVSAAFALATNTRAIPRRFYHSLQHLQQVTCGVGMTGSLAWFGLWLSLT